VWIFFLVAITSCWAFEGCPKECFCNDISQIVYCSRRGLTKIPAGIPSDTLQINLNSNAFSLGKISKGNFSYYPMLEHLYLSECNIDVIEVGTFSDLSKLKWLDISNNLLKVIYDYTFQGLSLQHLFLNGNRNIRIRTKSFFGLKTNGLYLHECSLQVIYPESLAYLNDSLQNLWLNGNQLENLDPRFLQLFKNLSHLKLGSNPLHCNCEVIWLKEFYDKNGEIFSGNKAAPPPSCYSPQRLKKKYFNALSLFDFRCQSPVFKNIDAFFDEKVGKLKCEASGDPAPTLYWIQPTGTSHKYIPPQDEEARHNEGVLHLNSNSNGGDLSGMYICLAFNDAGNSTLTLNVSWPGSNPVHKSVPKVINALKKSEDIVAPVNPISNEVSKLDIVSHYSNTPIPIIIHSDAKVEDNAEFVIKTVTTKPSLVKKINPEFETEYRFTSIESDHNNTLPGLYFSLGQLIGSVIGTHVCTLILCCIIIPLYLKRRWQQKLAYPNLVYDPNSYFYHNSAGRMNYMDSYTPKQI